MGKVITITETSNGWIVDIKYQPKNPMDSLVDILQTIGKKINNMDLQNERPPDVLEELGRSLIDGSLKFKDGIDETFNCTSEEAIVLVTEKINE